MINACHFNHEDSESLYSDLNDVILKFPHIHTLQLKGMRIGENLGEFMKSCKNPNIKHLDLELNGIEAEYVLYLNLILNFETLESLNISNNWIGLMGLERIKDNFSAFKQLKVLKIGANKLFKDPQHRSENLRDMIMQVSNTLEELYLHENSMEDDDLHILTPALV